MSIEFTTLKFSFLVSKCIS